MKTVHMLHKYEKIDEAMSACVALEYPLIVIVHGKLTSNLHNTEEAAHNGGNSDATTFSFLPPSYSTNNAVPFESTLKTPRQDAAGVNAALGYLMRPANLSAAAAADRSAVAKAVSEGEELRLVNDFPLGRLQDGAAQREALLIALMESSLGSVTLLHLIEEGTPAYDSFSAAVPVPNATGGAEDSGAVLPRVHIFYPHTVGLSPMVLHGAALTPQNVFNCVQMGLLRPRNRTEGDGGATAGAPAVDSSSGAASSLRSFFTRSVTSMNAEYERSRQSSSTQPQHSNHPPSDTAANASIKAPITSTPAVRATGVGRADALAAAHLISVAGLPTCFSTNPIPCSSSSGNSSTTTTPGSHKTILTTPAMTMQTVWRAVEKHLEWAQHEVQQARAASVWNGMTPPKPGARFILTVAKRSAGAGDEQAAAVVIKTLEEAGRVRLQDFPRNTIVQVEFEGWSSADSSVPATLVLSQQRSQPVPAPSSSANYVCEGDVCRRRLSGEMADKSSVEATSASASKEPAPPATAPALSAHASPSSPESVSSPNSPPPAAAAAPASIKLHCSLPNGKTLDIDQLSPATDTLQANVRPAVEGALGYNNFIFVCAYPAKRYSAEVDEPRLLKDIGLVRSSALRVVSLDGPGSPNSSRASGQQQAHAGASRQMLSNVASSLFSMFAGRGANPNPNSPPTASYSGSGHINAPSSAPSAPRRTYNSMVEMLAANEAAERETAMERLRQEQEHQQQQQSTRGQDPADLAAAEQQRLQGKKSNRYFGGGSTEYIAEDDAEVHQQGAGGNDNSEDGRSVMEGTTQDPQGAFLREQLQRLMRQQRSQMGIGEKAEEDDEEVGDGDRRGGSERLRAFHGQGRRLAGDGPSANANAQPGPDASQNPPPSDTPEAKKRQ